MVVQTTGPHLYGIEFDTVEAAQRAAADLMKLVFS